MIIFFLSHFRLSKSSKFLNKYVSDEGSFATTRKGLQRSTSIELILAGLLAEVRAAAVGLAPFLAPRIATVSPLALFLAISAIISTEGSAASANVVVVVVVVVGSGGGGGGIWRSERNAVIAAKVAKVFVNNLAMTNRANSDSTGRVPKSIAGIILDREGVPAGAETDIIAVRLVSL